MYRAQTSAVPCPVSPAFFSFASVRTSLARWAELLKGNIDDRHPEVRATFAKVIDDFGAACDGLVATMASTDPAAYADVFLAEFLKVVDARFARILSLSLGPLSHVPYLAFAFTRAGA